MRFWIGSAIVLVLFIAYNVRAEQVARREPPPTSRPSYTYRRRRQRRPRKPRPGAKTKVCAECHKRRPREDFASDRRTPDGRNKRCKWCHIEARVATLPAEQRDAERRRLSGRSRPTDGMTPEQAAEYQRVRRNEYQSEWQKRHPGYSTDIMRRWRASHPAKYAVRKAKERDLGAWRVAIHRPCTPSRRRV